MSSLPVGAVRVNDQDFQSLQEFYSFGYGMWPEGTVVYDPWRGIDYRKAFAKIIRAKAVLDSSTALIHATTDQQVLDFTRIKTPLQELIPIETAKGKTAQYDVLTSRNAGGPVVETVTSLTAQTDTYTTATQNVILWLEVGGWTDFNLLALRNQYPPRDARALSIRNKLQDLAEEWENEMVNGNLSTELSNTSANSVRTYGGANFSAGFPGFRLLALNSSDKWDALLINSKGGNAVTAADINNMLTNAADYNIYYNLAITDGITHDYLRSIVMSHVRINDPTGPVAYGINALRWVHQDGVCNIVKSQFSPNVAGYRTIVFLDTTKLAQRILLDATVEMLAKTAPQQTFMIKKFGTVIDKFDAFANSSTGSRKSHIGLIDCIA